AHGHTVHARALGALERLLEPYDQESAAFYQDPRPALEATPPPAQTTRRQKITAPQPPQPQQQASQRAHRS
ncbi:hypothetical protein AB0435_31900, partial [Streptomyces sp. NPDC051173]